MRTRHCRARSGTISVDAARSACLPARARAARLDRAGTGADNSSAIDAFCPRPAPVGARNGECPPAVAALNRTEVEDGMAREETLADRISSSSLWRSVVRHGYPDTQRNQALI